MAAIKRLIVTTTADAVRTLDSAFLVEAGGFIRASHSHRCAIVDGDSIGEQDGIIAYLNDSTIGNETIAWSCFRNRLIRAVLSQVHNGESAVGCLDCGRAMYFRRAVRSNVPELLNASFNLPVVRQGGTGLAMNDHTVRS